MINIAQYSFEGPYPSTSSLEDRSGVYAILDKRQDGNTYLLDCGESATVKTRVGSHDRAPCWTKNQQGTLQVAVYYTPTLQQLGRKLVEQSIRSQFPGLCGDR